MERYTLTTKQREFLIYIRDNHDGLGWINTIHWILYDNSYNENLKQDLQKIITKFIKLRDTGYNELAYSKPTKYLKIT